MKNDKHHFNFNVISPRWKSIKARLESSKNSPHVFSFLKKEPQGVVDGYDSNQVPNQNTILSHTLKSWEFEEVNFSKAKEQGSSFSSTKFFSIFPAYLCLPYFARAIFPCRNKWACTLDLQYHLSDPAKFLYGYWLRHIGLFQLSFCYLCKKYELHICFHTFWPVQNRSRIFCLLLNPFPLRNFQVLCLCGENLSNGHVKFDQGPGDQSLR